LKCGIHVIPFAALAAGKETRTEEEGKKEGEREKEREREPYTLAHPRPRHYP